MTRIQLQLLGFLSVFYGASSTIVTYVKTSKSLDTPQVFMDEQSRRSNIVDMKVMSKKAGSNMFVDALKTHFTTTKIQRVKDLASPAFCGQVTLDCAGDLSWCEDNWNYLKNKCDVKI
ncbi:hypothetical protein BG004_007683 [Podila humilis]|nr:hypothetical protein BG004_007683 [Podila humilis]